MFPDHIETERLHLRQFDETVELWDAYALHERTPQNEREMAHLTHSPHETPNETAEMLDDDGEHWEDGEAARYAVVPKAGEDGAGELAGATVVIPEWKKRSAYFGMRLREPFWGRGYSGERAAAMLSLVFDRLDLDVVNVGHLPENENSERAIEKYVDRFGGQYDGRFRGLIEMDGDPRELDCYSIGRDQFEDHRPDTLQVTIHD